MNLEQVSEMAKRVATEHEALAEAKDAKGKAEDELLALVIETIKPALPAMASKAGANARGVCVDRELRIYLDEDGTWFRLAPGGGNLGQGLYPFVMQPSEVLLALDLGGLVAALVQQLHQQIGTRDKVTAEIRHETQKLQAVAMLLAR